MYAIGGRRQWQPTPVLLPGKSHGRRSLVAAVHGVARSWTRLSDFTFTFHFHALKKEMATHSNALAWRIPGTGEPGGLPSRVGQCWTQLKWLSSSSKLLWVDSLLSDSWYKVSLASSHPINCTDFQSPDLRKGSSSDFTICLYLYFIWGFCCCCYWVSTSKTLYIGV